MFGSCRRSVRRTEAAAVSASLHTEEGKTGGAETGHTPWSSSAALQRSAHKEVPLFGRLVETTTTSCSDCHLPTDCCRAPFNNRQEGRLGERWRGENTAPSASNLFHSSFFLPFNRCQSLTSPQLFPPAFFFLSFSLSSLSETLVSHNGECFSFFLFFLWCRYYFFSFS